MTRQRVLSFATLAGLSIFAGVLVWHVAQVSHDLATVTATPPHIDQSADTLKQISDALLVAKRANKRVLLEFGSRGCTWCHLLQKSYETNKPIADELRRDYIVVMVDVSDHNNKMVDDKYGTPRHNSLPFTVILDLAGKPILAQNIAFADEDLLRQNICRIDTDKLLDLLKRYSSSRDHAN